MTPFIFSLAAPQYHRAGWPLIPVRRDKKPYVGGYHGGAASKVTRDELREWCEEFGTANVALVMPPDIIGIDVDAYDGKRGLATIAELEARLGVKLPPTYMSTARGDGSGIRYFRVPPGLHWPGNLGDDSGVDIIWWGDRYAVVAPSVHGKTGTQYRWIGPDRVDLGQRAPGPEEIMAELPPELVEEWTSGRRYTIRGAGRELDIGEAMAWLEEHGGNDEPCEGMERTLAHWLPRLRKAETSTRHDTARAAVWAVVQDAGQGHRGAARVLRESLYPAWTSAAGTERDEEFKSMIAKLVGEQGEPEGDPCDLFAEGMEVSTEDGDIAVPEKQGGKEKSAATVLVDLALSLYDLGQTPDGKVFGVPKSGPRLVQLVKGGRKSLGAKLAAEYYRLTRKTASPTAVGAAVNTLIGHAQDLPPTSLALRVGEADGASWLDLGDETGRVVRVGPDGWSVEASAPILFRRTELTAPLPEPEHGGSLLELWNWIRVEKADRPLVVSVLVAALIPEIAHPVPLFTGEQGTGKTFAGRILRSVLDPSPAPEGKPPRDQEAWVTAASGSWFVNLDNLSSIPEWLSDAICRAVSGEGDVRRKLYSDDELSVFRFRRCVILSGIDLGALRGDLEDRVLPLRLRPVKRGERREELELLPAWDKAHAAVLGALLDLACVVFAEMPRVVPNRDVRMLDFARVVAGLDSAYGYDGMARYLVAQEHQAVEAISGNAFAEALRLVLVKAHREVWTSAELHSLVKSNDYPDPKGWPKSARDVTTWLKRNAPVLRKAGWQVEDDGGHNKDSIVRWTLVSPK